MRSVARLSGRLQAQVIARCLSRQVWAATSSYISAECQQYEQSLVMLPSASMHHVNVAYEALNTDRSEVRLLRVEPGRGFEALHCTLNVVSLLDDPRYETISYCWGKANRAGPLIVNGSPLSVPHNAIVALCQVRSANQPRTVWIDAICINQDDPDERSQQVAMMAFIYRSAMGNLIHLGSTDAEPGKAARIAEHLTILERKIDQAAHLLSKDDADWQMFSDGSRCPAAWSDTDLIGANDIVVVESLYASAWFSRLWVVQEAAFAKSNTCFFNGVEIPLLRILKVGQAYIDTAKSGPLFSQNSERGLDNAATMRRFVVGSRKLLFEDIYMLCQRLATTDQRDMIFAVVNLYCKAANLQVIPALLRPDYQNTTIDVFQDATRYVLLEEGDWVLNHIHHRSVDDIDLAGKPSWMHIWGQDVNPREESEPFPSHHRHAATTTGHLTILSDSPSHVLKLKAFLYGKIEFVTSPFTRAMLKNVECIRPTIRIATDLAKAALGEPRHETADDLNQYALLASILTAGENEDTKFQVQEKAKGLQAVVNLLQNQAVRPANLMITAGQLHTSMKHVLEHRAMFSAARGPPGMDVKFLGLCPKIVQKDDVVAVIEGGRVPLVLRPFEGQYQFLGTAYVPFHLEISGYSHEGEAEWVDIV